MDTILVTGGCGFIGRRLIPQLLQHGARAVRVVDNLSFGTRESLSALGPVEEVSSSSVNSPKLPIQLIVGDIENADLAARACEGVGAVVHLAGNTGVGPSVENPRSDCLANVIGTFNYLEAARHAGVSRFIFASSGAVTGDCDPPIHERVPTRPVSPYGASKLAAEAYCGAYARSFGVGTVSLRFSNVYGPGSGHKQSVVAKFIRQSAAGEPVVVYGDGRQTRDFIYVDDLVEAIQRAIAAEDVAGEVFQIATMKETTVLELVTALNGALAAEGLPALRTRFEPARPGEVLRNYADTRKARELLDWQPRTDLAEGLRRTVRWAFGRAAA
jgi:UDP-glucose 4-epimerase